MRTTASPLFEINLTDLLLRHVQSNQKRETIAFSKRRQAGLEKAWSWALYRNFMAPRHVKSADPSPAAQAGFARRALTYDQVFARRVLPDEVPLPEPWQRQIRRDIETRAFRNNHRHRLKFAG